MRTYAQIISGMVAFLLIINWTSCTYVPLDGAADMPDSVAVNFNINWGGIAEPDRPEDMNIAMSRIINTVHYVWRVDKDGNLIDATVSGPADGDDSQDNTQLEITSLAAGAVEDGAGSGQTDGAGQGDAAGEPEESGDYILNGEYYLMIFNDEANSSYTIENLDRFAADPSVSMRDLYATIDELAPEDIPADVADFNPSFGYIKEAGPLLFDVTKQRIAPTVTPEIGFDIRRMTQRLTFRVRIDLEDGVTIKDGTIDAEISGVARRVQIMSGRVTDSTYRSLFTMHKVAAEGTVNIFEGTLDVLGLFPGSNPDDIVGSGILQLSIYAMTGEDMRLFHAGVNMTRTIMSAGLLSELYDGSGYRAEKGSALLEVGSVLKIDKDQILPGSGNQGVEIWFDSDKNDVDVEI